LITLFLLHRGTQDACGQIRAVFDIYLAPAE
jgi:hypothetical protein